MSLGPGYYAAVLKRWGRPAFFNGTPVTIVFDIDYGQQSDGEYAVETRAVTAECPASTVPGARPGDALAIGTQAYTVAAVQPDANDDWTRLVLERR